MHKLIREFRYSLHGNGKICVAVNIANDYSKTLSLANLLGEELLEAIPFEYSVAEEPTIAVLEGSTRKGMLSVRMEVHRVAPTTLEEAVAKLKEKGFSDLLQS